MSQALSSYLSTLFNPHAEADLATQIQQSVLSLLEDAIDLAQSPSRETEASIHDLRICFKQLRAYWQLMRYTLVPEAFQTAYERLSSAAKQLGGLRDQQVLVESLQTLRQRSSPLKHHPKATIDILIAQINEKTDKHPLQKEIDWYFIQTTLKVEQTFWLGFSQHIAPPYSVQTGFKKTFKKSQKLAEVATQEDAHEALRHRWRKWVKHTYYQLKLLNKLLHKLDPKLIEQFDALGNNLGKEHDMQVLINYLQQVPLEPNLQTERQALLNASRKHLDQLIEHVNKLAACET